MLVRIADSSPEQLSDLSQATEQGGSHVVKRIQLSGCWSRTTIFKSTPGLMEGTLALEPAALRTEYRPCHIAISQSHRFLSKVGLISLLGPLHGVVIRIK